MGEEKQMMCFTAGANAVFTGEKMLTTECNGWDEDKEMFDRWGLTPMQNTPEINTSPVEGKLASSWESIKKSAETTVSV